MTLKKNLASEFPSTSRVLVNGLFLNLASNFLLYLGHLIIARRLPREDYAAFTVIVSFVSLMALFADLGLTLLFVQKFAKAETLRLSGHKDERGDLLGSMLALRIIMSVLVSIVVIVITPILGYSAATSHLMIVMLVTLFISSRLLVVRSVGEAFLRAHNKYSLVAIFTTIDSLVFASVIYVYSGKILDLEGAIWIYSFCHIPGFLLLFGIIYRYGRSAGFKLRFNFTIFKELLTEGFPLILSTAFLTIHSQADALFLDKLSSSNEVSAFGAGLRVLSAIIFLPAVFTAVIGPSVTRAMVAHDFDSIRPTVFRSLRLLLLCAVFIAIALSISSDAVVNILFGSNKYSDAAPLAVIFGWTFIPICFGAFIIDIAIAEGKFWVPALYTSILMVISICFDIILIPQYGALGAVIAKLIAVSVGNIVLLIVSKSLHVLDRRKTILFFGQIGAVTSITLAMLYTLSSFHINSFLLLCIAGITFFLCAVFLFKIITAFEIRMFFSAFFSKIDQKKI